MISKVDDIIELFRAYVSSECQSIYRHLVGFSKIVLVQGRFNFDNYFSLYITIDDRELTILAPRELVKLARTFLARELNFVISSKYACCAAASMLFRIAIQNINEDDYVTCQYLKHCADVLFTSAVVGDKLKISKIFRFNIEKLIDCHINNRGGLGGLIDYICYNIESESSIGSAISKLLPHGEYSRQLELLLGSGFLRLCCAVVIRVVVGNSQVHNQDDATGYKSIAGIISNIISQSLCGYWKVYQIKICELEAEIAKLQRVIVELEVKIDGSLSIGYFSEQQEVFKKTLQGNNVLLQTKIEACSSLHSYFSIIENNLRYHNVDVSKEESYSDNISLYSEATFGAKTVDLFSYSEDSDNSMNIKLHFDSVKTTAIVKGVRTQVDDFMDSILFTAMTSILCRPIFDMPSQYSFNTSPIDGLELGKHVLQLNSNNSTLELEHIWPYPELHMRSGLRYKINFTPKYHRDSKIEVFVLNGANARLGAYFLTKNALNNITVNSLHLKFGTISRDVESVFIANNVEPELRTKLVLSCSAEDSESISLFERVSESLSQSNFTQNLEGFKKFIGDLVGAMNNIICSEGRIFKGFEMSDDLVRQLARGVNLFGSYDDGNISRYLLVMGVPMMIVPIEELQRESLSSIEPPSTLITGVFSGFDGLASQRLL